MGTRFPAIQELTTTRIRNVVRRALRPGLDAELLGDFLASVEWGSVDAAAPGVRAMLGEMESWATAYAEGELTRRAYEARLLSLLPKADKHSRLATGEDEVRVTTSGAR